MQGTRTVLNDVGYCARIVPAMSAPPYPHFKHKNAKILISFSSIIDRLFTLQFVVIHPYMQRIGCPYNELVLLLLMGTVPHKFRILCN